MKPTGNAEVGLKPDLAKQKDDDFVQVEFADGFKSTLPNFTVKQLKEKMHRTAGRAASEAAIWEGEHSVSHNKLKIEQRTDRVLLVAAYMGIQQIGNLTAWDFGDLPGTQPGRVPNDNPSIVRAAAYMRGVLVRFAQDELKSVKEFKEALAADLDEYRFRKVVLSRQKLPTFYKELEEGKHILGEPPQKPKSDASFIGWALNYIFLFCGEGDGF